MTNPTPLGRLERVNLRTYWEHEAYDFTPWLAVPENIALLGEAIGIELEVEAQEKAVGPFSADILCRDTATGDWVLIENQLERTDHSHLGQLLTYAAGLSAVTVVWIAERFTDEHRAALDWLNEHTNEKINFFGLEIELWRIGDSALAPKLNVVSKPNNWTKAGIATNGFNGGSAISETRQIQLEYWIAFRKHIDSSHSALNPQTPLAQNWLSIPIGRTGTRLAAVATTYQWSGSETTEGGIRAEVVLDNRHAKFYYALLKQKQQEIEEKLATALTWYNPESARLCRIYLQQNADITDRENWPAQHEWLRTQLERLNSIFRPLIAELPSPKIETSADS